MMSASDEFCIGSESRGGGGGQEGCGIRWVRVRCEVGRESREGKGGSRGHRW